VSSFRTFIACLFGIALSQAAAAQDQKPAQAASDFAAIATSENAANAQPGPRTTPARVIPVPTDVSPEMQAVIANPFRPTFWYIDPKTPDEWKQFVSHWA